MGAGVRRLESRVIHVLLFQICARLCMVRTKAGKVAIDLVPHIFEAHAGGTVLKTALVQPGSKLVRHDLIPSRERLGEKLHGEFFMQVTDFVLTGFVLTDFVLRWLRRMLQCTEEHYRW